MSGQRSTERIGFSGHQSLSADTHEKVRVELMALLLHRGKIVAFTSLAAGSDQIFAECVLSTGNSFTAVVPCQHYERSFKDPEDLARYRRLLTAAADTVRLSYEAPSEEAYWAAGQRIVDMADTLVVVWDGNPAAGLGGTGDVVEYAKRLGKGVMRVWPAGSRRG
jgi:hypothetical protein